MALVSEQLDIVSSLNDEESILSSPSSPNEKQHKNVVSSSPKFKILSNVTLKPAENDYMSTDNTPSETEQMISEINNSVTWTISKFESSGSEYIPSDIDYTNNSEILNIPTLVKKRRNLKSIQEPSSNKVEEKFSKEIPVLNEDLPKNYNVNENQIVFNAITPLNVSNSINNPIPNENCPSFNNHVASHSKERFSSIITNEFFKTLDPNHRYLRKPSARERPTICPICYSDVVTHFPRHLERHHNDDPEVQKILNLKPKSKERAAMINALRKRGYFYLNTEKGILHPMRNSTTSSTEYFVCNFCLGHYAKKNVTQTCKNL
ncbi:hypothetical protein ABEB36_010763 [Hypothenemus hampei]|uniref:Uncharacterized protein n=1 Tax=Hypothenemus hampei TaxID=57062 RepID=A0ABD1ECY8_HYPHA